MSFFEWLLQKHSLITSLQGPAATVEVVRKLISDAGKANGQTINMVKMQAVQNVSEADDIEAQDGAVAFKPDAHGSQADVAAEVADTAEKLDGGADT